MKRYISCTKYSNTMNKDQFKNWIASNYPEVEFISEDYSNGKIVLKYDTSALTSDNTGDPAVLGRFALALPNPARYGEDYILSNYGTILKAIFLDN